MDSPAPTDSITVLYGDLELFESVIAAARGFAMSADLQRQFLSMSTRSRPSMLTSQAEQALNRVRGYIDGANAEVTDDEVS